MQTIKNLMQKALDDNQDSYKALLEFRNTPSESSNLSPIEIMINRQTRSVLPVADTKIRSAYQQSAHEALNQAKAKQKHASYYNRSVRDRPPLDIGDHVRVKDRPTDKHWRSGTIVDCLPYRSYNVQLDDNSVRRRMSRHVRWSPTPPVMLDEEDDVTDDRAKAATAAEEVSHAAAVSRFTPASTP